MASKEEEEEEEEEEKEEEKEVCRIGHTLVRHADDCFEFHTVVKQSGQSPRSLGHVSAALFLCLLPPVGTAPTFLLWNVLVMSRKPCPFSANLLFELIDFSVDGFEILGEDVSSRKKLQHLI